MIVIAWLLALTVAPSLRADSSLFVGISDDAFKWQPETTLPIARDLGVTAVRITLQWHPSQTQLSPPDHGVLDHFVPAAIGLRVVLAVYGPPNESPQTSEARATYCDYVANVLRGYPAIRDVVIWNEANLGYFWWPQFNPDGSSAAPAAYAALLATCWDTLHEARPDVNVISDMSSRGNDRPRAKSNVSHSPVAFINRMGDAYRFSARNRPLLDTVGLHPYSSSSEVPWFDHGASTQISQGDIRKLIGTFGDAFAGTAQPLLGTCRDDSCPRVWMLETGFQTRPTEAKSSLYAGAETDDTAIPDFAPLGPSAIDQGTQMENALMLAYCQPAVGAIFNFLLADETDLSNWQSGLLWADGTHKASYPVFSDMARSVQRRTVDCASGAWNSPTATAATIEAGGGSTPAAADSVSAAAAKDEAPGSAEPNASAAGPKEAGASGSTGPSASTPPSETSASPSSGPTPAATTADPSRTAGSAHSRRLAATTRVEIIRLLTQRSPHHIDGLQIVKSGRAPGWYLADGFDRRTSEPVAAWFHTTGHRLKLIAIARTARQANGPRTAPCDIRPAFSKPLCG